MLRRFLTVLIITILTGTQTTLAEESQTSAKSRVETVRNDIIQIVETYPGDAKLAERRKKLRDLIEPLFDFDETAKLSLGPNWNIASPEEQSEFKKVYADYLARTYLSKIEMVEKDMISVDSEKVGNTFTTVYTTVHYKGQAFPLNYKLKNSFGAWKVYDVFVEGISLVTTNRNDFGGIIRKHKISGLIQMLKDKNNKPKK